MFLHLKGNRMHECKNEWYWKGKVSSSPIQHRTNWKSVSSTKAKDKKILLHSWLLNLYRRRRWWLYFKYFLLGDLIYHRGGKQHTWVIKAEYLHLQVCPETIYMPSLPIHDSNNLIFHCAHWLLLQLFRSVFTKPVMKGKSATVAVIDILHAIIWIEYCTNRQTAMLGAVIWQPVSHQVVNSGSVYTVSALKRDSISVQMQYREQK